MDKIRIAEKIEKQENAFGVKIQSNFDVYSSLENQAQFWKNENSCYCLMGDSITIEGTANEEFIRFLNPKSIFCNKENSIKLGLDIIQQGGIMCKNIKGEKKDIPKVYFNHIKSVYNLFVSCNMDMDYEGFLLDTLHKLPKGLAAISCIFENDKLIATALCSYITEDYGIISGVAVAQEYRNKGLGKKVLEKLEENFQGRTLFLFKEKNENDIFYKKLKYSIVGSWVLGVL